MQDINWRGTPLNVHGNLFPISHFCVYSALRHITWKLQVIFGSLAYLMTSILSKTLFVWFRVTLEIQLESYGQRHVSVVLWYDIVCVYSKSVYTSLLGTQLRLATKLTGLTIEYYTTNDGLTANDASLNFHSCLATLYIAVCRYVYTNFSTYVVLILAGTTVPLYEFAANQPKKEHKLGVKIFCKINCK